MVSITRVAGFGIGSHCAIGVRVLSEWMRHGQANIHEAEFLNEYRTERAEHRPARPDRFVVPAGYQRPRHGVRSLPGPRRAEHRVLAGWLVHVRRCSERWRRSWPVLHVWWRRAGG